MVNLGRCISFLLDKHGSVPLSGFGIFHAVQASVEYDSSNITCCIPSRKVNFTADPDAGSALLIGYIAAQRQIDETEAASLLREASGKLQQELAHNRQIQLDGLGILRLQEGVLIFEPWSLADPFSAHDPVPTITNLSQPSASVEPAETGSRSSAEEIFAAGDTNALTEEASESAPAEELTQEENSRRGPGFWRIAALTIGLLMVLAGGIWWFRPDLATQWIDKGQTWISVAVLRQQVTKEKEPSATIGESAAGPASQEILTLGADSIAPDTLDTVVIEESFPLSDPPVPVTGPVVSYEIIVGSFATMQQAEKHIAYMKEKGINLRVIDSKMPGNRKKISFGSYMTEADAYRALGDVQRTFEPNAWVARVER